MISLLHSSLPHKRICNKIHLAPNSKGNPVREKLPVHLEKKADHHRVTCEKRMVGLKGIEKQNAPHRLKNEHLMVVHEKIVLEVTLLRLKQFSTVDPEIVVLEVALLLKEDFAIGPENIAN